MASIDFIKVFLFPRILQWSLTVLCLLFVSMPSFSVCNTAGHFPHLTLSQTVFIGPTPLYFHLKVFKRLVCFSFLKRIVPVFVRRKIQRTSSKPIQNKTPKITQSKHTKYSTKYHSSLTYQMVIPWYFDIILLLNVYQKHKP